MLVGLLKSWGNPRPWNPRLKVLEAVGSRVGYSRDRGMAGTGVLAATRGVTRRSLAGRVPRRDGRLRRGGVGRAGASGRSGQPAGAAARSCRGCPAPRCRASARGVIGGGAIRARPRNAAGGGAPPLRGRAASPRGTEKPFAEAHPLGSRR